MTPDNSPNAARRIRLVSEGVVASYIHEISTRSTPRAAPPVARRHGRPARPAHARRRHMARPRELVALEG